MERKHLDFENLRFCLDNYSLEFLYVGSKYSSGGKTILSETFEDKTLDFKKTSSGLYLLIDSKEVFHFPLKIYDKGFAVLYERIEPTKDEVGKRVIVRGQIDPYDKNFPEPTRSSLINVLDGYMLNILFKGRIDIEFHSWWNKPDVRYWTIDKSRKI